MWSGHVNVQPEAEAAGMAPGRALGVGCGEGGDAIWLAQHGWEVTASDFADATLGQGRPNTPPKREPARASIPSRDSLWSNL